MPNPIVVAITPTPLYFVDFCGFVQFLFENKGRTGSRQVWSKIWQKKLITNLAKNC